METEMRSEIYASLKMFSEDRDVETITKVLGITPTSTWQRGDRISITSRFYKENGWQLKSSLPKSATLQEHVKDVLEQLQPKWNKLIKLCSKYEAELSCIVYSFGGDRPYIGFDKAAVKKLAELNATIDVDLYVL